MKLLKKSLLATSLSLILLTTACDKKSNDVVANVNGRDIKMEEFVRDYAMQVNNIVKYNHGDKSILKKPSVDPKKTIDQSIKEYILKDLIMKTVIEEDAKKSNIKYNEQDVEKQYNESIKNAGGEDKFKADLAKNGLNEKFYKDYLKLMNLMNNYYKAHEKELKPTDKEIKDYYEKHKNEFFTAKASHILVKTEKEIKDIKSELDKGANFGKLAQEKSIDTVSAKNKGLLGEFKNGQMVKEFNNAIIKMKPNEISAPIKTQFGYHIIRLESKKNSSFEENKISIAQSLGQKKFQEYNDNLLKKAKVKKYLDIKKEIQIPEKYQIKKDEPKKDEPKKDTKNTSKDKK